LEKLYTLPFKLKIHAFLQPVSLKDVAFSDSEPSGRFLCKERRRMKLWGIEYMIKYRCYLLERGIHMKIDFFSLSANLTPGRE